MNFKSEGRLACTKKDSFPDKNQLIIWGDEMQLTRNNVLKHLSQYSGDDEKLIKAFDKLIKKEGKGVCSVILHVLTHLDLEDEKAEQYWREIVSHRDKMAAAVGRGVNLRTAICDYFCSVRKSLKNPVVVEIKVFEEKLNSLQYDGLTGLYTRASFEESLTKEMSRAERYEVDLSLLFFDIDDFKKVNDTYGHMAGDNVLKKVSQIVIKAIRTSDLAARYGGEEIVTILPATGKVDALALGERIRKKVQDMKLEYEGNEIKVTVSGGVASYPIDANTSADLVQFSDRALYMAKGSGKNMICAYSQDKRRYLRINFNRQIQVRQLGFSNKLESLEAVSKDLSEAGLLFESESKMDIGTKVQLHIPVVSSVLQSLILGTVVRVEAYSSHLYDIGVSFLEMDKATRKEIASYLSTHSCRVYN